MLLIAYYRVSFIMQINTNGAIAILLFDYKYPIKFSAA